MDVYFRLDETCRFNQNGLVLTTLKCPMRHFNGMTSIGFYQQFFDFLQSFFVSIPSQKQSKARKASQTNRRCRAVRLTFKLDAFRMRTTPPEVTSETEIDESCP